MAEVAKPQVQAHPLVEAGRATRFKKGVSGNPGGVPKGTIYPGDYMRRMMHLAEPELRRIAADEGLPAPKRIAANMIIAALDGTGDDRRWATKELLDRTEGKAHQSSSVEVSERPKPEAVLNEARSALRGNRN